MSIKVRVINDVSNIPELEPTEFKLINTITTGVYNGIWSPYVLPNELYVHYFKNIYGAVGLGFGFEQDFEVNTSRWKSAVRYRQNTEFFSGAKTWHHVNDLSIKVFTDEGLKRPFKEFREIAQGINQDYNVNWLKTEQNSAFRVAQSAEHWHQITDEEDLFPWLRYQTAGDGKVRPMHAEWDGITRPVKDPFWDDHFPPNDFGCRCIITQLENGRKTDLRGVPKNDSKVFSNNPGTSGVIFPKTGHPYFKVPAEFKEAKDNNFGFVSPDKIRKSS